MPQVLMKSGEVVEIPDEEMKTFLEENRDLIQTQNSPRKRPSKEE